MKINTQNLTGAALDWAVAKCERFPSVTWRYVPMPENYTCGCGLYVHPSKRNWKAVHMEDCSHVYAYSTNWSQGGPIIDRERISLMPQSDHWMSPWFSPEGQYLFKGDTPLIAAMRCYVASKLGDEVDVPEELL